MIMFLAGLAAVHAPPGILATPMKKRFDLYSKLNQILLDASVFALAFIAAYAIRFEGWPAPRDLRQLVCWLPLLVLARLYVNYSRGIYQLVWRFVSLADALKIAKAIAASASRSSPRS